MICSTINSCVRKMKKALNGILPIIALLLMCSCAKKTSIPPATNTPIQTNPNTNFSVDGVPANDPNSAGSVKSSSSTYVVTAIDNSGYPQITVTFPQTVEP